MRYRNLTDRQRIALFDEALESLEADHLLGSLLGADDSTLGDIESQIEATQAQRDELAAEVESDDAD